MTNHLLRHGREVAGRRAVALKPTHLDVGRRHDERVTLPPAGRESAPGMRREIGGMRPSVHPDHAGTAVAPLKVVGDEPPRVGIDDLRESDGRRATQGVVGHVRDALTLVGGDDGLVPALGFTPACLVERQSGVIAELHPASMGKVLVECARPFARQIDLREGGCCARRRDDHEQRAGDSGGVAHIKSPRRRVRLQSAPAPSRTDDSSAARGPFRRDPVEES